MNANMGIRRQGAGLGCSRWFSETGAILYEVKLGEDLIHQVALERARAMAEQRNAFRSSSSRMVRDSQKVPAIFFLRMPITRVRSKSRQRSLASSPPTCVPITLSEMISCAIGLPTGRFVLSQCRWALARVRGRPTR